MNARQCVEFLRSPTGRFLGFGLLLGAGLTVYSVARKSGTEFLPVLALRGAKTNDALQKVETMSRPMEPFRPPSPAKGEAPVAKASSSGTNAVPAKPPEPTVQVPPISLRADATAGKPAKKKRSETYAPYGRLIPCETVITIDSSSIQTPVVGLITEDIHHAGRLVIPAGTEVHGSCQVDRTRERIASGTAWTLVWQSGEVMRLRGIALDREFDGGTNQAGWGITDGSAGLRGQLVKADDLAEVKLFGATLLSGAAKAMTEREATLLGALDSRSLNNAPLKGAEEVLGVFAQRTLDSIERDGFYIRVPSGKQFYLYALQSIDRAEAHFPGGAEDPGEPEERTPAR